ncbi:hypothetical protein [Methanococcus maripaludis]|uniref:Uncharacterized protein n=1 Tax=Methanococcus maripaludis TaxID=39152 RepID=A0A7J9PL50_METMI|nr:hypothetical protein [Methanococcus maripaludis]MBA2863983.1 hypothetical protein [Methanococcus maripaludis]
MGFLDFWGDILRSMLPSATEGPPDPKGVLIGGVITELFMTWLILFKYPILYNGMLQAFSQYPGPNWILWILRPTNMVLIATFMIIIRVNENYKLEKTREELYLKNHPKK